MFEHPGEQTFPVSCFVVKRGGMVVFCAGTTGFNLTFDARFVWMRQKRIQGSHFANLKQASAANKFVIDRRIDPCMSEVFPWAEIPVAHTKMWKNQHEPGNMAVLVNAPTTGLRTFEDVLDAAPKVARRAQAPARGVCLRSLPPGKATFQPRAEGGGRRRPFRTGLRADLAPLIVGRRAGMAR